MLKNNIIEAVAHDLLRFGLKECRMDYIANSLHISKKTLYEYFGSKRNLLYECISYCVNRNIEQIEAEDQASVSPIVALVRINSISLRHALDFCPAFHRDVKLRAELSDLLETNYVDYLHSCYTKYLMLGIEKGVFKTDINISHTVSFFDEQISNMYIRKLSDSILEIDSYVFVLMTYLAGICTDVGRKELISIESEMF